MISLQVVSEFVHQHFSKVKVTKHGTQFNARCSLCGDSKTSLAKRRFYLDWNNGDPRYHCFNCDRAGSFIGLYADMLGMSFGDAKKALLGYDADRIKAEMRAPKTIEKKKDAPTVYMDGILNDCIKPHDFPDGLIETQAQKLLNEFIAKRKIPEHFKIFAATKGRYKGRAIIPVYRDGHIIYFQGRALVDIEPKYLNPIVEKGNVILNEEHFDRDKYIVVTEGLLDAFMIGNQGTSVLGASISEDFIDKISKMSDKGIILVLDNDVTGKEKLLELLEETYTNYCKFFIMPDKYKEIKDLNEWVIKYGLEDVYKFVVDNSYEKFNCKVRLGLK
jgi:DNA primase